MRSRNTAAAGLILSTLLGTVRYLADRGFQFDRSPRYRPSLNARIPFLRG
jgi:hypothetical protein